MNKGVLTFKHGRQLVNCWSDSSLPRRRLVGRLPLRLWWSSSRQIKMPKPCHITSETTATDDLSALVFKWVVFFFPAFSTTRKFENVKDPERGRPKQRRNRRQRIPLVKTRHHGDRRREDVVKTSANRPLSSSVIQLEASRSSAQHQWNRSFRYRFLPPSLWSPSKLHVGIPRNCFPIASFYNISTCLWRLCNH